MDNKSLIGNGEKFELWTCSVERTKKLPMKRLQGWLNEPPEMVKYVLFKIGKLKFSNKYVSPPISDEYTYAFWPLGTIAAEGIKLLEKVQ